ncbi:uncharacterized protein TRIVIDRAFT_191731 [Trichoderma virens Gv29-8]|uniref:Cytochrome P450 monooxygenase n=1 Tax=Hypocrea virens (strain Gv29-8 / FGSC 10586) TaxID=413071 RepID=G9MTY7_HYPVG|nr:uncharacterized protein TRIVIDRAFT_191731 [Trichoderma virens Gv29-8]EHK22093.1 hypothetical protein TRIVIDRAFT_191731 [Trichoderma virens Gv29-8]UKZ54345.1 hypothetical protein TrVGV298_008153 [Trichoderma virens]
MLETLYSNLTGMPLTTAFAACAQAVIIYCIWRIIYQIYFHPLSKFPGPWLAAVTYLYKFRLVVSGNHHKIIDELHKKYGETIRIGPNELSCIHPTALKDVYGHHPTAQTFTKDPRLYSSPLGQTESIVTITDINRHAGVRRLLSHAFSDRALSEQEDIIQMYVDKLMVKLRDQAKQGPFNIIHWFNFFTFDIIGELSFGESFNCLSQGQMDDWITVILGRVKALAIAWGIRSFPLLNKTYHYFLPASLRQQGAKHMAYSRGKVSKRLQSTAERKDFISCLDREGIISSFTVEEISAHTASLVLAGSDTTATSLSGICYYLSKNPEAYKILANEIRNTFQEEKEITHLSCQRLSYLQAVIEEGLRLYPPLPIGAPRLAPKGGAMMGDIYVPDKTYVSVPSWTLTHLEANFPDAWSFKPERWLSRSSPDLRDQSQPFLLGPRGCIGRNLAMLEMRLVLSKLFWNFDFEIINRDLIWERDQTAYIAWQKPQLIFQLTPRRL